MIWRPAGLSGELVEKVAHTCRKSGGKGGWKDVPKSVPKGVRRCVPKGVCKSVSISVGRCVGTGVRKGGGRSGWKGGGEGGGKGGAHTLEKRPVFSLRDALIKEPRQREKSMPAFPVFPSKQNFYVAILRRQYRHRQQPPCQPSTSSRTARCNIPGTAQRMNRRASESSHRIRRISSTAIITRGSRYIINRS